MVLHQMVPSRVSVDAAVEINKRRVTISEGIVENGVQACALRDNVRLI